MPGFFYLSAAHKSSGKTTLGIGLAAALCGRGLAVQPFKKGPDYIDPLWLEQAAGRPCYNLDFNTQEHAEIGQLFARGMQAADVGLVEGNKGLFDGMDLRGADSNGAMAKLLGAPIVLVLDTQGMTRGVAPLVLGYQAFDPELRIAGVILNKVAGPRHESKLRQVMGHYTDIPVLGAVHRSANVVIAERHLGLVPANESEGYVASIARIAAEVAGQVDLDALLAIADSVAAPPAVANETPLAAASDPVRIGVARDSAFGFYYQDDFDALRRAGAELVPFSPLDDSALPACDGLFFGGGFPETHVERLAANTGMLAAVRAFVERDGPVYAECGGLMYLARNLTWEGKTGKMAGVIQADVIMHARPPGRGYVRLRENARHPWPHTGAMPDVIRAHEFHYSGLEHTGDLEFCLDVERGHGVDGRQDGILYRNVLASYAHLRHSRSYPWCDRFVAFVRQVRDRRADAGSNEMQR